MDTYITEFTAMSQLCSLILISLIQPTALLHPMSTMYQPVRGVLDSQIAIPRSPSMMTDTAKSMAILANVSNNPSSQPILKLTPLIPPKLLI